MHRSDDNSGVRRVDVAFADTEALEHEIEANLRHGRAFLPDDPGVAARERCTLVLVHPMGETLEIPTEVVFHGNGGVGLEMIGFDDALAQRLAAFAGAEKSEGADAAPSSIHARVRHYNTAEQLRAARTGDHAERVALECVYGKAVWEVLLRNPRITPPEVTRLARNPKLPKRLVDVIVGNAGWLSSSSLRRSLLLNPQVSGVALDKVLRAMSPAELTRVSRQGSFPIAVRQAAKRIQGR